MIRRMADKLGHLGHASLPKVDESDTLSSLGSPTSPNPASYLSQSSYDHRGSISTQATSMSEWSTDKRGFDVHSDMEVVEEERPHPRPKLVSRPRGVYRLSDFIIQRTLGTGSFGRVHLGLFRWFCGWLPLIDNSRLQYGANTTCASMLSRSLTRTASSR